MQFFGNARALTNCIMSLLSRTDTWARRDQIETNWRHRIFLENEPNRRTSESLCRRKLGYNGKPFTFRQIRLEIRNTHRYYCFWIWSCYNWKPSILRLLWFFRLFYVVFVYCEWREGGSRDSHLESGWFINALKRKRGQTKVKNNGDTAQPQIHAACIPPWSH